MGLSSSPNSFQLLMDKLLRGLTYRSCLCYLDDVLVCSETFQQHISDLNDIFTRFRNAGLKLNPKKCSFRSNLSTNSWNEFGEELKPMGKRWNLKVPKQVLKAVYFELWGSSSIWENPWDKSNLKVKVRHTVTRTVFHISAFAVILGT
jgi:hypothetical protein